MQRLPFVYVAETDSKGRGVFTAHEIQEGDLIEVCPVIEIPEKELALIEKTVLFNYYFLWGEDQKSGAICLGFGSLYNHEYMPNARYEFDYESRTIDFYAIRDIAPGEEITVNYHGDAGDMRPVWFELKK
ncbi:MAG: SET domain-containing protein-lysine N-methyltransferase [Bacteroidetes bacterium]|nr:MAG: SET domain-containing protein-lysine N-methyltransferase [Bacteroidota bacterium]